MAPKHLLAALALIAFSAGAAYLQQAPLPAGEPLIGVAEPASPTPKSPTPTVGLDQLTNGADLAAGSLMLAAPPASAPHGLEAAAAHTVSQARIAIIIDDIGDQWDAGKRAAELPGDITLAVLPFTPYAQKLAALAQTQGKELMLHAPMEPLAHRSWKQGLNTNMDETTLRSELRLMLASLPAAKGVNNHMGSALTQDSDAMTWVMDELAQRQLYFIDSRTTAQSTALAQARQRSLASAKRDVFLDNSRNPEAIGQQFQTLIARARQQGSAIAIGHPYPETLAFLYGALQSLEESGVELVPVSQILAAIPPPADKSAVKVHGTDSASIPPLGQYSP